MRDRSFIGQPFAVWLGLVLMLVLLKYSGELPATLGGNSPQHVRIGGYNVLTIGTVSVVFIVIAKAIANRWPVPGVTDLFNAV